MEGHEIDRGGHGHEILRAKRELHPDLWLVTGLHLGAEQLAAEAARAAGVPYVAVQPYPEPDSPWPAASRDRYADLVRHADGLGLMAVVQGLEALAGRHGPRFLAARLLLEMAREGKTFFEKD